MKKNLLLLISCLCMTIVGQAQGKATSIQGEIKSLEEGAVVELYNSATYSRENAITKTTVKNGVFAFAIEVDGPRYLTIEGGPSKGNFSVAIEPGDKVLLKGESFRNLQQSGSKAQQMLDGLIASEREFMTKYRSASQEEKVALREIFCQKEIPQLIARNSDNLLTPILIYNLSEYVSPSEKQYATLSEEVKNSFLGKKLRGHLNTLLTGKKAPAFTAKDINGKEYSLESLLQGHKYLLVDFWASWCRPCRQSLPEIKKISEEYAAAGLVVVSISVDKKKEDWLKAVEEEKNTMKWISILDESGISKKYFVGGIPSVFLIDENGVVLFEKLYGDSVGNTLKKLIMK